MLHFPFFGRVLVALCCGGFPTLSTTLRAETYTLTDLGTLGGTVCVATGISADGQVVGYSSTAGNAAQHAFRFANGTITDLGALGGTSSTVLGVSPSGTAGGHYLLAGVQRACLFYTDPSSADLGVLGDAYGGDRPEILALNDFGAQAGSFYITPTAKRGFLNRNGVLYAIPTLGGTESVATAINAANQVAGYARNAAGEQRAFSWTAIGGITNLGTLGGNQSNGYGINDAGVIVGSAKKADGNPIAFRHSGGVMIGLGTLGGPASIALAINSSGVIVGVSDLANLESSAFIYSRGRMRNLNALLSNGTGWTLYQATAINDRGQIVGNGRAPNGQMQRAFLLTPNPDTSAPVVSVAGKKKIITKKRRVKIRGTASDDEAVTRVEYKAGNAAFRQASGTSPWQFAVALEPGPNRIQIRARDAAGNISQATTVTIVRK